MTRTTTLRPLCLLLAAACGGEAPPDLAPETATATAAIRTSARTWAYNHHGFPGTMTSPGRAFSGDFDGDGLEDIVVLGSGSLVATAYNQGNRFRVVYTPASILSAFWTTWVAAAQQIVVGDFNGDGRDDIALVGGQGWTSIPTLRAQPWGGWALHMEPNNTFCFWAAYPGVKAAAGDFDGNGRDDIALTGGAGWSSLVVGYHSNYGGGMRTYYRSRPEFASLATVSGARLHAGDFDGNGRDDLALTGGTSFSSIPFALALSSSSFTYTTRTAPNLVVYGKRVGAKVVTGDFDGDGDDDLAVAGGFGNTYLRIAFTKPSWGGFYLQEWSKYDVNFSAKASAANAVIAGQINGASFDDIALLDDGLGYAEVQLLY